MKNTRGTGLFVKKKMSGTDTFAAIQIMGTVTVATTAEQTGTYRFAIFRSCCYIDDRSTALGCIVRRRQFIGMASNFSIRCEFFSVSPDVTLPI